MIVLGMIVVFAGTPASAQALDEEIANLLATYPLLDASRANVAAADDAIDRAFADYLPQVTLTADYGYERTDSPGTRAALGGDSFGTQRDTATLTITENVFDGYRTTAGNATARINRSVTETQLELTKQRLIFRGTAAYLNVLRHVDLVRLAIKNERTIQRQLQLEDERVQRGAGISVDVLQSKSRLQIAKERRVAFEGNLRNAITRFYQLFDHAPEIAGMSLPNLPDELVPTTLAEAEQIAAVENPVILRSNQEVDLASQRKRIARSGYYPSVDVVAEFNYENDDEGIEGVSRDASIILQARWDLFSGFRTRAEVAGSSSDYLAALDNRNQTARQIVEDVGLSWEQLRTVRQRVELLRNAVSIAIEVHVARRRLREAGQETVINVLDAENEVFNAQINATDSEYDARIAVYRLILAIGRLTPGALGIQASAE
jgi:adhesin transport system outer membrane protein